MSIAKGIENGTEDMPGLSWTAPSELWAEAAARRGLTEAELRAHLLGLVDEVVAEIREEERNAMRRAP